MKKSLALILILCMALASVPALGETDFTGSWYLTLSGMICGVFELKDDGTCTGSTAASDTEAKINGTWTADGNAVTLTVDGQPLSLVFDGTDLTLSAKNSSNSAEAALGAIVKFTREPAGVTIEELNAYASDGTVPEGKTKEDMEAVQDQLGMLIVVAAFMN